MLNSLSDKESTCRKFMETIRVLSRRWDRVAARYALRDIGVGNQKLIQEVQNFVEEASKKRKSRVTPDEGIPTIRARWCKYLSNYLSKNAGIGQVDITRLEIEDRTPCLSELGVLRIPTWFKLPLSGVELGECESTLTLYDKFGQKIILINTGYEFRLDADIILKTPGKKHVIFRPGTLHESDRCPICVGILDAYKRGDMKKIAELLASIGYSTKSTPYKTLEAWAVFDGYAR